VILGDPNAKHVIEGGHATLDDIFRAVAAREPDRIALTDPPNRTSFTDGAPRRLTYREADRVIGAIAGRLRRVGLPADTVIGLQLPNTVEAVLTILGVLRAGMIAAPLPLLWRRSELVAALRRVGAKAIVTSARVGGFDHGMLAMEVAGELFAIRHVCGFGNRLLDGVLPLDDVFAAEAADPLPPIDRFEHAGSHVAVVTFDVTPQGMVALARSHNELIAGSAAVLLEGSVPRDARILTPCPPSSFAGLALGLLPWLLSGGGLTLHQPFDPDAFAAQCLEDVCDTVVVPGPLLPRFAEAGLLAHDQLRSVLALWRAPERLAMSPACRRDGVRVTDVLAFGEIGLVPAQRGPDGWSSAIPAGPLAVPRGEAAALPVVELSRTPAGVLALRGVIVPRNPFPPGAERDDAPRFADSAQGPVDTGYACRIDPDSGELTVTSPPGGLVDVGGYRFVQRDLQSLIGDIVGGASFAALPHALLNHRLAGYAADRAAAHAALAAGGRNALIAEAFAETDRAA
jgi:hypothetical protein